MSAYSDFFGDVFGQEGNVGRYLRALGREWGKGAMKDGGEDDPTDWGLFLAIRAGFFADLISYVEATLEQAYPNLAEHTIDVWEYIKNVPPGPSGQLTGERLQRLMAFCQAIMGARPADIVTALENLAGADVLGILERTALQSVLDPDRVYEFYTLVTEATFADEDLRDDINEIVDRWKPAHTEHGSHKPTPAAPGFAGGVRVGQLDANGNPVPVYFKTGGGPEKTGRNLIPYS